MNNDAVWYFARGQQQVGPMTLDELVAQLPSNGGLAALVFGPGMQAWTPAAQVPQVAQRVAGAGPIPPPVGARLADRLDYQIFGEEMQYVVVKLESGAMAIAEPGNMMFMSSGIEMESRFGDPSSQETGFLGKIMTAGKRVLTGENLFMTTFTATGFGTQEVGFAAPYPGTILAMDLCQLPGNELICQKDSFLAAARGVSIGIAFQKRLGVGLFGGEGFIMQRLSGSGIAFVHAGGCLMKRTLQPGETLKIDTGCIVAYTKTVNYDIQFVGGFKNKLFGGEGLFFATLTGPGDVWLQSLPFSRLAGRIVAAVGGGKGEGSVLGGLGRMIDGDNA
jgi:uncharacterized protein (TIGR00266 family)